MAMLCPDKSFPPTPRQADASQPDVSARMYKILANLVPGPTVAVKMKFPQWSGKIAL